MGKVKQVKIEESTIQLEDGNKGTVAIFLYEGEANPMVALDDAVKEYVGGEPSSQFIDINMGQPLGTSCYYSYKRNVTR